MDSPSAIESPATAGTAPASATSPLKRAFERIFTRHLMNIAILMALPVIFTVSLNPARESMRDPDIWWHLADARQLMTTHHFIWTEPNSFTVGGQPWVNPEWLAELPYWFSYQALHLRGIYFAEWVIICANLIFLYWRGFRRSGHAGAAWWAAALAFLLISVNSGPRTISIAYLAMSSELAILEAYKGGKTRALWLLPPLFCIWINLHGSWLIGLALFVLYILCGSFEFKMGAIEQEPFAPADRNRLLTVLAVSVAVLLINPYGWHLMWNPIDMMSNQKLNIANVMEWKPLNLSTAAGVSAFAAMCLMVVANAFKGRKWRIYELAFIFFAWYAALDHMRFAFLAAVITTPFLAVDIRRGFNLSSDEKTIPAANAFMVAAAALVILFIFPTEKNLKEKLGTFFPMQSLEQIQPSWRTFDSDTVGGMMAFLAKPDFIDSRFDIFEHRGVLGDYLKAMYLVSPLEVFDHYRIDHVLVTDTMPVAYLLKHTEGWTIVKSEKTGEDVYVTFARTPGARAGSSIVGPTNK
ncbi:hypothetical protein P8935_20715 [Telmatobacter sp. DSM 110680]|uniref:Glycosyltransferase RgtA/B/C/D-like domain-containing protein n=1 Tax=Telmatobacter sp. DSM 110680 TaxID=3036704 RepID=A0AAU7DI76_9BACT